MKVYVSHSRAFNYKEELYEPLRKIEGIDWFFPHDADEFVSTAESIKARAFSFILAEVSFPSTGQGIELGRAEAAGIPIFCIYRKGTSYSEALTTITSHFFEYQGAKELQKVVTVTTFPLFAFGKWESHD